MIETTATTNHKNFSGVIEIDDFSTEKPNKKRIANQSKAVSFPDRLITKKRELDYASMSLDELRAQKIISNTDGRPTSTLTNEKWQREFRIRKKFVTPVDKKQRKMCGKHSFESRLSTQSADGTYFGMTNWQSYCQFINDILRNIRSGQVDYCYYIYQIMDLLRFHRDTLQTRYYDGYWAIWLEGDEFDD